MEKLTDLQSDTTNRSVTPSETIFIKHLLTIVRNFVSLGCVRYPGAGGGIIFYDPRLPLALSRFSGNRCIIGFSKGARASIELCYLYARAYRRALAVSFNVQSCM